LPLNAERKYYVYLLDYGWREPLGEALHKNFRRMADAASRSDAIVLTGTRGTHFEDEVLSWHHINGYEATELLPAVLITTRHPAKIKESHRPPPRGSTPEPTDALLLIPLKKVCRTAEDVADLIEKIFSDIRSEKALTAFRVVEEMKPGRGRALVNAIVLEPNVAGVGINLKEAVRALFGKH
jgi:hypothetical protein